LYTQAVNGLRREQITALLLGEDSRSSYRRAFKGGLSFLVDAIILMRYVELDSAMQRAVLVLKMRGSPHAKEIRRYVIGNGGLTVLDIFKGREGLLSGTPHGALP
jgi:circadian clock protein KaiC